MIIDVSLTKDNYKSLINNKTFPLTCPYCNSVNSFHKHGKYKRTIVYFKDDRLLEKEMHIQRVKCCNCNHTHAILPQDIMPYKIYTIPTIVKILSLIFIENKSIPDVSKQFFISFQLLYKYLSNFKKQTPYNIKMLIFTKNIFTLIVLSYPYICPEEHRYYSFKLNGHLPLYIAPHNF